MAGYLGGPLCNVCNNAHGLWTLDNGYLLTKTMTALLFYFVFKQENMTMIGVMFVSANFQYFDGGRLAYA